MAHPMIPRCARCQAEIAAAARFCPACGAATKPASDASTTIAPTDLAAPQRVGRLAASDSIASGFTPGVVLGGRYRIIGLVGRGGMGEVYRADDLKLGQPVALKFLPRKLSDDSARRAQFYSEVRIARRISHPNVCRVHDIGEVAGLHFLSMEYIDGEDLASLLKRIGYLPQAKALELAKQLCAGLGAAHEKGVLHRDLKPANIMIDGRGQVRITDFGLAVAIDHAHIDGDVSGTPVYMAPEQLAGQPASVQSDIYALGLVLFELYTGKRAFTAASLAELRWKKEQEPPIAPSEITPGIDPAIERVIQRCLERNPRARPMSVVQVAAALPGGDLLAAALAAGETPSPEMVAASGPHEGLRPVAAWALLAATLSGLAAFASISRDRQLMARVMPDRPPDALAERSREILRRTGHADPFVDSAYGIGVQIDPLSYVLTHDQSPSRFDRLPADTVPFWYRQSPRTLERVQFLNFFHGFLVSEADPPLFYSGEALVTLDAKGRLINLTIVPAQFDTSLAPARAVDWMPLFREAGLEPAKWTPATPEWTPAFYADTRVAWTGSRDERPDLALRVEAASYQGRPISFTVLGPWSRPARQTDARAPTGVRESFAAFGALLIVLVVAAAVLARRNLRMGRGDRRGAVRVALAVMALQAINWLLDESHVAGPWEFYLLTGFAGWALFAGGLVWVLYLALEPHVRRTWPALLVSWNRLLAGDFRNPLVGRDVLIGCATGTFTLAIYQFGRWLPARFGLPAENLAWIRPMQFLGARHVAADLAFTLAMSTILGLAFVLLLSVSRMITRSRTVAVAISVIIGALSGVLQSESLAITIVPLLAASALQSLVMARVGLIATIVGLMFSVTLWNVPLALQVSQWYAATALTQTAALFAIILLGFSTSLRGRPVFGRLALD